MQHLHSKLAPHELTSLGGGVGTDSSGNLLSSAAMGTGLITNKPQPVKRQFVISQITERDTPNFSRM